MGYKFLLAADAMMAKIMTVKNTIVLTNIVSALLDLRKGRENG
jgi:hypothetical protein